MRRGRALFSDGRSRGFLVLRRFGKRIKLSPAMGGATLSVRLQSRPGGHLTRFCHATACYSHDTRRACFARHAKSVLRVTIRCSDREGSPRRLGSMAPPRRSAPVLGQPRQLTPGWLSKGLKAWPSKQILRSSHGLEDVALRRSFWSRLVCYCEGCDAAKYLREFGRISYVRFVASDILQVYPTDCVGAGDRAALDCTGQG